MIGRVPVTVIIGTTAIGKSDYAFSLAKQYGGEIISADAFQVYRYMNVGTAKISFEKRQEIPHYLIDIKNPDEPYNVTEFVAQTQPLIADISRRGKRVILCGGTAFYLNALLYGYQFIDQPPNQAIRDSLYKECEQIGNQRLWEKLVELDPEAAQLIPPQNTRRLIRAFEIYRQTGDIPSHLRKKKVAPIYDAAIIQLTAPRDVIYQRINDRVDQMMQDGLVEEVRSLLQKGYPPTAVAFQALGYKETIQYLGGSISFSEMVTWIKQKTRHFAKRQLTWFKRFENVYSIDITKT